MASERNIAVNFDRLVESIKTIILNARRSLASNINHELIATYWNIGREIVQTEQNSHIDSNSSRQLILILSKQLTAEVGKGFSRSNLFNMRKFFLEYPDVQTVSGQLSWSHLCELLIIEDGEKRAFYENETLASSWSVRELKRQIDSSLYERIILSTRKIDREKILKLSKNGQQLAKPEDIVKNPYVFEFLGLPKGNLF